MQRSLRYRVREHIPRSLPPFALKGFHRNHLTSWASLATLVLLHLPCNVQWCRLVAEIVSCTAPSYIDGLSRHTWQREGQQSNETMHYLKAGRAIGLVSAWGSQDEQSYLGTLRAFLSGPRQTFVCLLVWWVCFLLVLLFGDFLVGGHIKIELNYRFPNTTKPITPTTTQHRNTNSNSPKTTTIQQSRKLISDTPRRVNGTYPNVWFGSLDFSFCGFGYFYFCWLLGPAVEAIALVSVRTIP